MKNNGLNVKKIVNAVGKILSAASIIFVVYAMWKLGFNFGSIDNMPSFILMAVLGIILKIVSVFISASTWSLWLEFWANKKIDYIDGICVYTKANIGKYIPGNVMHYVERNLFAAKMGIPQKKIAASTAMEIICQVFMALFIFLCTGTDTVRTVLDRVFGFDQTKFFLMVAASIVLFVSAAYFVFRKKIGSALSEYNKKDFVITLLKALIRYFFVLSLLGVIMVILYANAGGEVTVSVFCSIVSGYIVAWVLGFITPGASGGIGVRELVIILLLGPVIGRQMTVSLSVIHRLITVVGDFCAYFIRLLIQKKDTEIRN